METGKKIEFKRSIALKREIGVKEAKLVTSYWTEVDGMIVPTSCMGNEIHARNFYNKVVELNGEVYAETILESTTFHLNGEMVSFK